MGGKSSDCDSVVCFVTNVIKPFQVQWMCCLLIVASGIDTNL